jgi:hypothetical protein
MGKGKLVTTNSTRNIDGLEKNLLGFMLMPLKIMAMGTMEMRCYLDHSILSKLQEMLLACCCLARSHVSFLLY